MVAMLNQTTAAPRLLRLVDLLEDWERDAVEAHAAFTQGKALGPVTGLPQLDRELGGHLAQGFHVLHGGTGVGKTGLASQVAADCGCRCLFVTTEMSPLDLLRRTAARVTGVSLSRLTSGELPPDQSLSLARRAATDVPDLTFAD